MRELSRLCVTIAAMLFLACPALAQGVSEERILSFTSDITVARNGDLTVTETITVLTTGDRIKHGIYRDFPTEYTNCDGSNRHVRFDIASVTRDGKSEPYELEDLSNGVRVKIGDKDVLIDPSRHTYVLSYITDRTIIFSKEFDELYWNVTGNGWSFGIDRAEANIHLPDGAKIMQRAFYTGPTGAKQKNAAARIERNRAHFTTTAPLMPLEGLTIAIGFAKGAITPPSGGQEQADDLCIPKVSYS